MAKALSMDLRERLISAVEGGMSRRSLGRFSALLLRVRSNGLIKSAEQAAFGPRARGGDYRSHRLEAYADEIVSLAKTTDVTRAELVDYLRQTHGFEVAPSTVWRPLDRYDMTFKKTAHAAEQQRPDVLRQRQAWFDAKADLKPEKLVFIDETGASIKMARRYG